MSSEHSIDVVTESLAKCGERAGDVVPAVYERFFALSEEGLRVMDHADQHMQGRMFEEVVGLLISDEPFEPAGYLDWELDNHLSAYNATAAMYEAFFAAIVETVKDSLGSDWSDRYASAWHDRISLIMQRVNVLHRPERQGAR